MATSYRIVRRNLGYFRPELYSQFVKNMYFVKSEKIDEFQKLTTKFFLNYLNLNLKQEMKPC